MVTYVNELNINHNDLVLMDDIKLIPKNIANELSRIVSTKNIKISSNYYNIKDAFVRVGVFCQYTLEIHELIELTQNILYNDIHILNNVYFNKIDSNMLTTLPDRVKIRRGNGEQQYTFER